MDIVKGQPLTLPDGSILLPDADASGSKVVSKTAQQENAAREQVQQELDALLIDPINNEHGELYKRTLADIDVDFARMNVVMLVASYTLWGLDSYAISRVLNVTINKVEALQQSDQYTRVQKELIEAMRYAEAATVHGYLTAKSHAAARVVASSLTGPSHDLRLSAAKDILDRSGFRPVDRVEHVHKFEDELRIRYVQDDAHVPTIDLDAAE